VRNKDAISLEQKREAATFLKGCIGNMKMNKVFADELKTAELERKADLNYLCILSVKTTRYDHNKKK
jgi:hypothetical protein